MILDIKHPKEAAARLLAIVTLYCFAFTFAAPPSVSSSIYTDYEYTYEANVASAGSVINLKARANLEVLYAEPADPAGGSDSKHVPSSLLVRLQLADPVYYAANDHSQPLRPKNQNLYNPDYDLYAHIETQANGTAHVRQLFTHKLDATTYKNIKKSILLNLLPTSHHLHPVSGAGDRQANNELNRHLYFYQDDQVAVQPICTHDNNADQPELFSPDSMSQVHIIAKSREASGASSSRTTTNSILDAGGQQNGLKIFQSVDGYQNVTFKSRVFAYAQSNLTTDFHLNLLNEASSSRHKKYAGAKSIHAAIKLLDTSSYELDTTQLERERKICSTHHCGHTLAKSVQSLADDMSDESMASIEAAVAFLRILNRLRESKGSGVGEITEILKASRGHQGLESSLIDVLTAARTKSSIIAVLKHIRLAKQRDLTVAERFLSTLSVVAKTTAKMHSKRDLQSPYYFTPTPALKRCKLARESQSQIASLEFITKEFLNVIESAPAKKWKSDKLRWSCLLTLATLVNSYHQELSVDAAKDPINLKVSRLLLDELGACEHEDADCRIVVLQAIGNIGFFGEEQYQVLKREILESGKRESVVATKVLRDLLQNQPKDKQLDERISADLKDLLLRVVYDNNIETTSRVLAAEMIVRFTPNSQASEELLRHLPSFGNYELATMIYSRIQSLKPNSTERHHENWYWRSCVINGTSTSFVRTMAETQALNASYGVNVEMNKAKILKESSFDVFLDTKQRTQDILSLGIFVRGVSGFSGADEAEDDSESTMAGMSLRLLGGYLRPLVFFTSMGDLIGHVMRGTASEPTTAFNGNLLLIDHDEGYPLVSGFVAEQQMRGVLSIDVLGKVHVSYLWSKEAHSVVRTKAAAVVQASQSVFTGHDDLWQAHLFSFGGGAMIDFVADIKFNRLPAQVCLQVTQPEFSVRYNSRHHRQMAAGVVRRITRRHFEIGAKSYPLNAENNKMCSAMIDA